MKSKYSIKFTDDRSYPLGNISKQLINSNFALNFFKQDYQLQQNIFNHSACGIIALKPNYEIIKANQKFADIINVTELSESLNKEKVMFGDLDEKQMEHVHRLFKNKITDYCFEKKIITQNGEQKWFRFSLQKIDPKIILIIIYDIDELKRREEELSEMQKILSESLHKKDRMFLILAHDLRNHLQTILGLAGILSDYTDISDIEFNSTAKELYKTLISHKMLLDSLLEWTRISLDKDSFQPGSLKIHDLINDIQNLFILELEKKKISVENRIEKTKHIIADREGIQTVLRNIIYNAIKYCNYAGEITIDSADNSDFNIICISDSGPAIKVDVWEKKPTKSVQAKNYDNLHGFGLNISKEIIEKHGGKLSITGIEMMGTEVKIFLPKMKLLHQRKKLN